MIILRKSKYKKKTYMDESTFGICYTDFNKIVFFKKILGFIYISTEVYKRTNLEVKKSIKYKLRGCYFNTKTRKFFY